MFEGAVNSLISILSLSVGGVSIITIIAAFIVLSKKIKSTSLTKDYVEKAFEKAVLPANVRIDISQKILPLVKQALEDIKENMKDYLNEQIDEIGKVKQMIGIMLKILSKFSHTQQLTDEELILLKDMISCTDEIKNIEV